MKKIYNILIILPAIILYSCGGNSEAEVGEESNVETTVSDENNTVIISAQQYKAIDLQLGNIEQRALSGTLQANGFLKVPPESKADITALMPGTIKDIFIKEGDKVSKGQTLVTIVNPEFIKMQEEYLNTENDLQLATSEYIRQKGLSEKNISAQKTFQEAESNYKMQQTKSNSLKSQLALLGIDVSNLSAEKITSVIAVKSPVNGSISEIDVNIGSYVEPTDIIMDVIDNSHLHLDIFIFEQDLPKINIGQKVTFNLINLPGKSYEANIFSVASAFENETKTISAHAEITGNKSGLIEGMNVSANIEIENTSTSALPSKAIISNAGNDYIFIQKGAQDGTYEFEKIQVKKGITNNGYTEITPLKEIPADAKVVTNGVFYLLAILTNAGEEE
ncbi:MAG: efflux RND transporter periplasmic adaptor subunit [Chitinophagales bacterium]|nr:efflux RND transporter periplasmic adaptor subunit [Chitinophagales bacterium]